jgi:hypothetical protein
MALSVPNLKSYDVTIVGTELRVTAGSLGTPIDVWDISVARPEHYTLARMEGPNYFLVGAVDKGHSPALRLRRDSHESVWQTAIVLSEDGTLKALHSYRSDRAADLMVA